MNTKEIADKAYAEVVSKMQQKVMRGEMSTDEYDEAYENARTNWLMEQVKSETNNLLIK